MTNQIIRLPEVLARTGMGKTTLYRKVSEGQFPLPAQIGIRSIGWYASEIDAWISARPRASTKLKEDSPS